MKVRVSRAAKIELAGAVDWYDGQAPGVTLRFLAEYEALLDRLADNPHQFPSVGYNARRAGFRHFPYGLFYRIRDKSVEVFACFHNKRNPAHWQRRTP